MNFKKPLQNEMLLSFHHVGLEFGENKVKKMQLNLWTYIYFQKEYECVADIEFY